MASPFTVFRKHQKILIATLGLLAMIAFVFLGTIQQQMGGRAAKDPVVVSTKKYGDITERRLHYMRAQRRQLFHVLQQAVAIAGGEPRWVMMQLENIIGTADEEPIVNTWLIVQHAKQLGMRVNDKAVNDFFKALTGNRVSGEQLNQLLKRMDMSEAQFFDLMSDELLAINARQMFETSLKGIPPAQRWDYFQRLKREVTIEVAPVPVARYVDQVAEPDEATLQAFFDEHKRRYADPASPEPGFRVPRKIALEYFKAEYDKFTDAESVTDKEIEAYYQENRDRDYLKVDLPGLGDDEPAEKEPPNEKPNEEPSEAPAEEPVEETLQQQAHGLQPVGFDENIAPNEAEKPGVAGAKRNGAPENTEKPAQPKVSAEEKTPEKQGDEEPDKSEAPDKIEYKPLKEVEGEIRKFLAQKKAHERIMEKLGALQLKMKKYRSARIRYNAREKGSTEQPPVKPDMARLARENNLALYATELISEREAYGLDIGKSYIDGRQPFVGYAFETLSEYRQRLSQDVDGNFYLFWKTDHVDERMPELADEEIRREVLQAWKIVQARALALNEARRLADVVRKAAREADNPSLAEALATEPGVEVHKTEPFTWMTLGAAAAITYRTPPRISEIEHVEAAGHDFMRAVYDLDVGRIGVATNQPQTVAYVIRLVSTEPDQRVLWRLFRADDFSKYSAVAREDSNQVIEAWRKQLERGAGLTWERPPDQHAPSRR
jgi:hypothetical protein